MPTSGWLTLGRKLNDRALIQCPDGAEIWVTVARDSLGHIKLHFKAPPAYRIVREEVLERKPREAAR